jgi:hypothetical protein
MFSVSIVAPSSIVFDSPKRMNGVNRTVSLLPSPCRFPADRTPRLSRTLNHAR